jgi:xanthine dehydrogenase iron-sulfur cluster and FAD-binding subunit A
MFSFRTPSAEEHPSLHAILNLLGDGQKDNWLLAHLCKCAGCRSILDRHRRLVALDNAIGHHPIEDDRWPAD